jgi:valyl-tRNA synthetase
MNIPEKYNSQYSEARWYSHWLEGKYFESKPDEREPYSIVIPPPNVTGVLHMGHMLNNTLQDILVRRARMKGKNSLWVPGTDHASIATEAKVVNKLKSEGIEKADLTREQFLEHAWEWTHKHGGIILEQLKKLGASCAWDRTAFTMDEERSESVIKVFCDLYEKGLVYKGYRMVNWDPSAQTALSDEEVIHKEEKSKLYYVKYQIEGEDEFVTIATTRPETILGDTAVCVNPNDDRFKHLIGKKVIVPMVNRAVPVIGDDYVDVEFGTGCLKITPAHDENDYNIGKKHDLEFIDIFTPTGKLNEKAQFFVGEDRFEVRKLIIPELEKAGNLVKVEDYDNKVGYSERTDVVIEPRLSEQWYLNMKELAKPALDAVMQDDIKFYPRNFKNTYRHWMENIQDWCISRQLWWGHQIPVYYLPNGEFVVAETKELALEKARAIDDLIEMKDLKQDEDALDTWFSSWLWPISVFDGINNPNNEEINYYYPTADLVTGPDIMFFWVARMIMAGYQYEGKLPFKNVYFTGIVRDSQRRKMSKQLGNSPDPLDLIEKYGADGVRVGMLLCAPAGGDLLFDESLPEQGRNFTTKVWNAFRLVNNWKVEEKEQPEYAKKSIEWFTHALNKSIAEIEKNFEEYRLSDALMNLYTLFKDEFSSWYLEMVKPAYGDSMDKATYEATINFFDKLVKVLHPFMPFISEEIWQLLKPRAPRETIMIQLQPAVEEYSEELIKEFEIAKSTVAEIRTVRKEKNLPMKEALELMRKDSEHYSETFESVVTKLSNISKVEVIEEKPANVSAFIVNNVEYFIPLGDLINKEEEIEKLEKELDYTKGFLNSVMKKLSNERFVNNAPEKVVAIEKNKQAQAEEKIVALEAQIKELKS